ncbi:MAG: hypothetical protein KJ968_01835 [Nanoarchaeota archaeon]|nr:hypothetical protein [Nanoarchaeota archaeon]
MKLKVGKKLIPIFEKKKAAPVQRPNFSGTNSGFQRPTPGFPVHQPMGQRPVFKPGPSIYPGVSGIKKEKSKDITKIIANLPRDELTAYVSIILGLIFIFIAVIIW